MAFELIVEAIKYVIATIAPKGVWIYKAINPAIPKLIAFRYNILSDLSWAKRVLSAIKSTIIPNICINMVNMIIDLYFYNLYCLDDLEMP